MKRLLSILLAVAMVMAFAMPAMATETTETSETTETTEHDLLASAYDMTYYVGGYGAVPGRYQCMVDHTYAEWFDISYGDPIVAEWPTEAGTYTVNFTKTTAIEGAGDTEYTFDVSMNITVLELPALSGQCGDNMNWSFDTATDTLTISGTGDMYTIANSRDDISNGLYTYEPGWWVLPVKNIVVEEGVNTLSDYAFMQGGTTYNTLVKNIQLPTTLTAIAECLFGNAVLKTLTIPEGITELGGWLIGVSGNTFGDLDALYLPSTLTKLDMATVVLASIGERDNGSRIELTNPDFLTIYFAGTQEQWDAVEFVDTIHIESGEEVLDNAFVDEFMTTYYNKTVAELFAEVTVVCTGKEKITVENGTATVPDSSVEITEGEDVVIDVTDTEEEVSSVVIGSETVDKIADAQTSVEVKLPDATVSFDKTAIGSIGTQAGETAVTIVAKEVEDTTLTAEQNAALADKEVLTILSLEAYAGETKITDFGGGKVTVSVPFELPEGKTGTDYYVAYVADDGTITAMPTTYADGVLTFETTHFSNYVVLENVTVNPPADDTTDPSENPPADTTPEADPDNPKTGDNSHLMLFAMLMVVSAAALVVCTTKRKIC